MPNLYKASKYKDIIINLLLKNSDFITLMNPPKSPHEKLSVQDIMFGGTWVIDGKEYIEQGQIFDYNFVNDTIIEEKTFVFIENDIDIIRQDIFTDFNLYVYIFTSKSLVRITNNTVPSINDIEKMGYNAGYYGNRIDILCDIIDRTLNGNKKIKGIGDIKPAQRGFCTMFSSPGNKYYGKCLKYNITNLNETERECE